MKPTLKSKYNYKNQKNHINEARDLVALSLPRITHPEVIEIATQFLLGQLDVTDDEFLHGGSIIIDCGLPGLEMIHMLRTLGFVFLARNKRETRAFETTEYRFLLAKDSLRETLNE